MCMHDHLALYKRSLAVVMAILDHSAKSSLRDNPNRMGYTSRRIWPGVKILQSAPEWLGSSGRTCEHEIGFYHLETLCRVQTARKFPRCTTSDALSVAGVGTLENANDSNDLSMCV